MKKFPLKEVQKTVKDLILFDSVWKKRKKIKTVRLIPEEAIKKIETYRNLVKTSFSEVITNVFPYTHRIIINNKNGKKTWLNLFCDYIEQYPPSSPLLSNVAENFPVFISTKKQILMKYPFLAELTKYEWTELVIYEKENVLLESTKNNYLLNPIHKICDFSYPIPKIIEQLDHFKKVNLRHITKESTHVLIYRDPVTLKVRFLELSQGALAYIELLKMEVSYTFIPVVLAEFYKIEASKTKAFNKELNKLIMTLKKNRVLLQ